MEAFTIHMTSAFIVMMVPFINLHTKLKARCIQLAKKVVEEAFPNIMTHFTVNTSDAFFSFHYYVPSLFYSCLISSTSTKSNSTTYLTPVPTPVSTFMSSGGGLQD